MGIDQPEHNGRGDMSAEIINLRQRRKQMERAKREAEASVNRLQFGRSKADRSLEELEKARETRQLDGAERVGPHGEATPHADDPKARS